MNVLVADKLSSDVVSALEAMGLQVEVRADLDAGDRESGGLVIDSAGDRAAGNQVEVDARDLFPLPDGDQVRLFPALPAVEVLLNVPHVPQVPPVASQKPKEALFTGRRGT